MKGLSVVLTSWKRPHLLARQIKAIREQTFHPVRLIVWHNRCDGIEPDQEAIRSADDFIYASYGLGVWARFLPLLEESSKYLCVFDDDTIPGRAWLDNALGVLSCKEGVVGTCGVRFPEGTRSPREYVGWPSRNTEVEAVDICGHCWLFTHSVLSEFVKLYRHCGRGQCGEDYALSWAAQRLGFQSWVPRHPPDDKELWGSVAGSLGMDDVALYRQPGAESQKEKVHQWYRSQSWRTLAGNHLPDREKLLI